VNKIISALSVLYFGAEDELKRVAENVFSGCASTQRENPKELELFLTLPPNLNKPTISVYHSRLCRTVDDSAYRSLCPCCENGTLLVYREKESPYKLKKEDMCICCGQNFCYLDIDVLNEREGN
jgi:hypothetical protein